MQDDDAEFQHRLDSLAKALSEHLGGTSTENAEDAEYILMRTWLPFAGYDVCNTRAQRAVLADLLKNARKLALTYLDLESPVQDALRDATPSRVQTARYRSAERLDLSMILALPELIQSAIPSVLASIGGMHPAGRTNWIAVGIVADCRELWARRTGSDAPRGLSNGTKFGDFLSAAFKAAELDADPRSAIDAWNRLRTEGLIPPEF